MTDQRSRLRAVTLALALAFAFVALALGYWSVVRSPVLDAREDNPRVVEAELRVRRGRIYDTNDVILAETTGPIERLQRTYPVTDIGPAIGYYSVRYGTIGVEQSLDNVLRGSSDNWQVQFRRQLLHAPQIGRDVRLTLNAGLQSAATSALEGRPGAILVLSLPDGAIRVLASQPGYDPNLLDDMFETLADAEGGPLVNRVTQGQYQPGLALQPIIMAALLAQGRTRLDASVDDINLPVEVNGSSLACLGPTPAEATLADALAFACPQPMLTLARLLNQAEWAALYTQFGLSEPPIVPLDVDLPDQVGPEDLSLAAIGQDTLVVTPLQLGMAWMAVVNEGTLVQPRLVAAVVNESGQWETVAPSNPARQVVSQEAALAVMDALPRDQDIVEHVALALAGPDGSAHAWYLAAAPATAPRFVVTVIIEGSESVHSARTIGREVVDAVFARR